MYNNLILPIRQKNLSKMFNVQCLFKARHINSRGLVTRLRKKKSCSLLNNNVVAKAMQLGCEKPQCSVL